MYINQQKRNAPSAGGKWKNEQYKRPSTETIWNFYVEKVWGNNPYTIPRYFFTWKLWVIQKVMLAVRACQVNLRFLFIESSPVCLTVGSHRLAIGTSTDKYGCQFTTGYGPSTHLHLVFPGFARVIEVKIVGCVLLCAVIEEGKILIWRCAMSVYWRDSFSFSFLRRRQLIGKLLGRHHVESPKTEPGFPLCQWQSVVMLKIVQVEIIHTSWVFFCVLLFLEKC